MMGPAQRLISGADRISQNWKTSHTVAGAPGTKGSASVSTSVGGPEAGESRCIRGRTLGTPMAGTSSTGPQHSLCCHKRKAGSWDTTSLSLNFLVWKMGL